METVDISQEPYDEFLSHLKKWRYRDSEILVKAMDDLYKYDYSCIAELQAITKCVIEFHREICKEDEKSENEHVVIEIDPKLFAKIKQLKTKLKNLEKEGHFEDEKTIKRRLEEVKKNNKNLVNVKVIVPPQLLVKEKNQFYKKQIAQLYKAFITYFPQAYTQGKLNSQTIRFIQDLMHGLKKRSVYYVQLKQRFSMEVEKICNKFRKEKYRENKLKMLDGQITVPEVVYDKPNAFFDFQAEKVQQKYLENELKQSEAKTKWMEEIQAKVGLNSQDENNEQSEKEEIKSNGSALNILERKSAEEEPSPCFSDGENGSQQSKFEVPKSKE